MRDQPDILHVDLDAFYASVEQLDRPELRGKPVVVGGTGRRGVVCAASYEARTFGVHSAMPTARARRAAPQAIFLPPRFDRYAEKSNEVMRILRSVTPVVEQLSIDEAFVDAGGLRRRLGTGEEVARMLRARIASETGLRASVGVASTKFLAKVASDMAKPDGLLVVAAGSEVDFLDPLPAARLWGAGPATLRKLDGMAVHTIGDVARLPEDALVRVVGAALGRHLRALARNEDDRDVEPEREVKSIGAEETFDTDLRTSDACDRELVRLADRVTARLRNARLVARTITLKVRFGDFETKTRARTLPEATDLTALVTSTVRALLDGFDVGRGIRLLGVSLSQLERTVAVQQVLSLDDDPANAEPADPRADQLGALDRATDAVRERFGDGVVQRAVLLGPHET